MNGGGGKVEGEVKIWEGEQRAEREAHIHTYNSHIHMCYPDSYKEARL